MTEDNSRPTRSDRHKKKKMTAEEKKVMKEEKKLHEAEHKKHMKKGFFVDVEREEPEVEDLDSIWDDDPAPKRRGGVKPILAILLLLLIAVAGLYVGNAAVVGYLDQQREKEISKLSVEEQEIIHKNDIMLDNINILVLGCDEREGESQARSDVIMVATLRPQDKKVAICSIPRDSYVAVPGHGNTKINHSMSYGGVDLVKATVEQFMGIQIDHTVKINFDGFINVVDALGGVNINVEKRMYKPLESIDLYPGEQTLMGKDALAYVRWRGDATGDFGRINRQQIFLGALTDKLKTMNVKQTLDVAGAVMDSISTDMSVREMTSYGAPFIGIGSEDVKTYSLGGEPFMLNGVSYVRIDKSTLKDVVEYMQYGEPEPEPEVEPEAEATTQDGGTAQ